MCLTEETTELLYLLGEEARIVGITAYTVRPAQARERHPVVSAFIGGSVAKIKALAPDLVIGFSDVQAEYARSLIAEGLPVLIFNQRSIQEILEVLVAIGGLVGRTEAARELVGSYVARLDEIGTRTSRRGVRPRVYFEEWNEPMISAIRWVSELIHIAGGENVFDARTRGAASKDRIVTVGDVRAAAPEVVLASWCGKPLDARELGERLGSDVPAVRNQRIHEVPSELILQPGPAALTEGLDMLVRLLAADEVRAR